MSEIGNVGGTSGVGGGKPQSSNPYLNKISIEAEQFSSNFSKTPNTPQGRENAWSALENFIIGKKEELGAKNGEGDHDLAIRQLQSTIDTMNKMETGKDGAPNIHDSQAKLMQGKAMVMHLLNP